MLVGSEQSPPVTIGQQSIEYVDNFYVVSYISRTGVDWPAGKPEDFPVDTWSSIHQAVIDQTIDQWRFKLRYMS